jgi:F-box domain
LLSFECEVNGSIEQMPSRRRKRNPRNYSRVPVLPAEIQHQILSYLPLKDLFFARGVNKWYHAACLVHIDRFLKGTQIEFTFKRSVPACRRWWYMGSMDLHPDYQVKNLHWFQLNGGEILWDEGEKGRLRIILSNGEVTEDIPFLSYRLYKGTDRRVPSRFLQIRRNFGILKQWYIGSDTEVNWIRDQKTKKWLLANKVEDTETMSLIRNENGYEVKIPLCKFISLASHLKINFDYW